MSGQGSDSLLEGGGGNGLPPGGGVRAPRRSEGAMAVGLPVALAVVFLCSLPIPGLIPLPQGASLGLVTMLAGMPIWYEAARARHTPFDPIATRAISVILTCAGFLVFWSIVSIIGADFPFRVSRYLATLIAAYAIYFMVRSTVTRARVILFVDILAVGLAATAVLSLLAFKIHALHELIFKGTDRAAGFFKNPNQFGMAISTTIPALMALVLVEQHRRLLRVTCLILMLLGLFASGSKTNLILSWVSILAVVCGHAWIFHTGARRFAMLGLSLVGSLAAAGLGILVLTVLNPRALAILSEFLSGYDPVNSLVTRRFLWTYSIDQFLADPILGQGAGQPIDIFYREEDVAHSHNVLLDYMRTLGAPGLFVVSLMIAAVVVVCLMSILRSLRSESGAPAARLLCLGLSLNCLTYIVANMSSDSFGPSTSPIFWVFVYLAFAARNLMRPLPALVIHRRGNPAKRTIVSRFPALASQVEFENARNAVKPSTRVEFGLWLILVVVALIAVITML